MGAAAVLLFGSSLDLADQRCRVYFARNLLSNAAVPQAAQHRIQADDYLPAHQIEHLPDLLDLFGFPSDIPWG